MTSLMTSLSDLIARRFWLSLVMGLFLSACGGAPGSEGGLTITNPASERPYFYDFGALQSGVIVEHTFELRNDDDVPVTIQDLQASCSCSAPEVSYTDAAGELVKGDRFGKPVIVLPPGAVASVVIEVDTSHVRLKNVDKLAQVRLRCDSPVTPFITFEMHMIVELAFQVTPEQLNMKDVPISGGGHISTDIIRAIPGSSAAVLELLESTPGLEVNIDAFESFGEKVWRVSAVLMPPLELGPWRGEIQLSTTKDLEGGSPPGPVLTIPVLARVVQDIVFQPATLGFSPFSPANGALSRSTVTALAAGHRIKILSARVEGDVPPGLELTYEPKTPDGEGRSEEWRLELLAPPTYPRERVVGKVVVELDDPNVSSLEAAFILNGS
jgi:hypothetical protein